MNKLKLNETPIRTSRNFHINNIKLEDVELPEVIGKFENMTIIGQSSKIKTNQACCPIDINYGLKKEMTEQVKEKANQKLHCYLNSKTEKELQINFQFDENNLNLVDDIEIIAEENTRATVIVKYETKDKVACYHNGIIRTNIKKGAKINLVLINLMNITSQHFISLDNQIAEDADLSYTMIDFGGKNSVTNYYSNLFGSNAKNGLYTIYLGRENQLFDLNYIGELRGANSKMDMEIQGALKDFAKKHFKGTIDFKKGCKKAKGNENESCMLLSDTARSIALPMLLCSEEEVEGNHSSSAGKIDEKEQFYLMSRGFTQKEAMKLMVRARFNKILEKIKNEELKQLILRKIDERLD